ncbi:sensor domain-containing protein [Kineococcus terrestris]|uniref:sensor domain-containing protein n=1 Tax=Kineococcus terrestris TaxID=2044856 RepID=UPI0034DADF9C
MEHGDRGTDGRDDALARALERAGGRGPDVDVAALLAGARGRARTLRRRRAVAGAVAGAVAVLAVAVPVGAGALRGAGPDRGPSVVATRPAEPELAVPAGALPDDTEVTTALPGAELEEVLADEPGAPVVRGLCRDDASDATVAAGRAAQWRVPADAGGSIPLPAAVRVSVRVLDAPGADAAGAAAAHVAAARAQAPACADGTSGAEGTGPWTVADTAGWPGDEAVAGWARTLQPADGQLPAWTVAVVARTGDAVVEVRLDDAAEEDDVAALVQRARELTGQVVQRAAATVPGAAA